VFGYDIPPPAIYEDNSLAISGFYGTGFCRYRLDGQKIWSTQLWKVDLFPTINSKQFSAVGSLDWNRSFILSNDGQIIGTYKRASIFSEYLDGGWIALSEKYIARLTLEGKELWGHSIENEQTWDECQPIVDSLGQIFITNGRNLFCYDSDGNTVFNMQISQTEEGTLSIIYPGLIAVVCEGSLSLVQ